MLGIKMSLDGRLAFEKSRPRATHQIISRGTFSKLQGHIIQIASYTRTNYKNTYTITVWVCFSVD